jgi:hypothetical protein
MSRRGNATMTEDKRKQILDMLDTLQEHLLSLPDDIINCGIKYLMSMNLLEGSE